MSVLPEQRHKRSRPCLVCGGGDDDTRGKERRCSGFISADGDYEHCSREELAGPLEMEDGGTFAHRMHGSCRCGTQHGEAKSEARVKREPVATYDYTDEGGRLLFQVVRFPPKEFRQRRPDGAGGWIWQLGDTPRVLYRLPELLASGDRVVHVVEGEKDVESLRAVGCVATCNPGGAGKWHTVAETARRVLLGRDVIVVADADGVGRLHAAAIAASLEGVANSVRVVEAPAPHKDVTAMLEAGLPLRFEEPTQDTLDPQKEAGSAVDILAPELPFDEIWTPEPESDLVIPALGISPGPAHLVTGSWYTGKTLLLATMGLSVAAGKNLFGVFGVKQGRWVHFDHEMGRRQLKRYVQRLQRGMGLDIEELRGFVSLRVLPSLNLTTTGALEHYCRILDGCALATVDPLRAAAPGMDENKSEFRQYLDLLATVSNRTGCAIEVLHHGGKPTEGAERRNTGRGTSAIDDAVQSKFVLTAKEKGAPMLVSHEKSRELTKPLDDFYLEIDNSIPDAVRLVHRGLEEMSGRLETRERGKVEARVGKVSEAVLAWLAGQGGAYVGPRSDIFAAIGGNRTTLEAAWVALKGAGRIRREGNLREPTWRLGC